MRLIDKFGKELQFLYNTYSYRFHSLDKLLALQILYNLVDLCHLYVTFESDVSNPDTCKMYIII